jgi:hypothetical protein
MDIRGGRALPNEDLQFDFVFTYVKEVKRKLLDG